MSKDKKNKKPFKERAIGKILSKVVPAFFEEIKDKIPGAKLLMTAKDLIFGKKQSGEIQEQDFAEFNRLYELELQELDMRLKDTQNAREMQMIALQQGDKFSKWFVYILAIIILGAAVAFGVMLFFIDLPADNFQRQLIQTFANVFLFAGAMAVINFFFGSSAGSKRKTDLMSNK